MSNMQFFRRGWLPVLGLAAATSAYGLEAIPPEVRHERITLSTGVTLHVAEAGPRDGRPVLFLHGYSDSWVSWTAVVPHLPADVRAILVTARGHGDSDRPECCYGLADFAADAVAVLDALGIRRASVVGHSMGSFVAQRVAVDHPARVERLVLIGSGATLAVPMVAELSGFVQTLTDPVDPGFIRDFQHSTVVQPVPTEFMERVIAESTKLPARVWRETLAGIMRADVQAELGKIAAPTLVVWGDRDGIWDRAQQDELIARIPDARLAVYEATGHGPNWERPARLAADLAGFLDGR